MNSLNSSQQPHTVNENMTLRSTFRCVLPPLIAAFAGLASAQGMAKDGKGRPLPMSPNINGYTVNAGQWDSKAILGASTRGLNTWVTKDSLVFDIHKSNRSARKGHVVRLELVNSTGNGEFQPIGPKKLVRNFIYPEASYTGVKTYREAVLDDVYQGIDWRIYGTPSAPRFDFIVAPNADPGKIRMQVKGAKISSVKGKALQVATSMGPVTLADLNVYQSVAGKKVPVAAKFNRAADGTIGIKLGKYNRKESLVIDPVIFATYVGAENDDHVFGITVDDTKRAYTCGVTASDFFPITDGAYNSQAPDPDLTDDVLEYDMFVNRYSPDAFEMEMSTVIGGPGYDHAHAVAVDRQRRVIVVGETSSAGGIQTTSNAVQKTYKGGSRDAIVIRLGANGTLNYSSYLGGTGQDKALSVDVDGSDNFYVAGQATAQFPTTAGARQPNYGGGLLDGFLAKFSAQAALVYSTFHGGNQMERVEDLDVDANGFAYVTGFTKSPNFPLTAGAFDTLVQYWDSFVSKYNQAGNGLIYSTVVGGSGYEYNLSRPSNPGSADILPDDDPSSTETPKEPLPMPQFGRKSAIAVDRLGNAYVTGFSESRDFPLTRDSISNFMPNNYLYKLATNGASLVYSTGIPTGAVYDVQVDNFGLAYLAYLAPGMTTVADRDFPFPRVNTVQENPSALWQVCDFALTVINEVGTGIVYGSEYGLPQQLNFPFGFPSGPADEIESPFAEDDFIHVTFPRSLAIDRSRDLYVGGLGLVQTVGKVLQPNPAGAIDGFLMKIRIPLVPRLTEFTVTPLVAGTETAQGTVTVENNNGDEGVTIFVKSSNDDIAQPVDGNGQPITQIFLPKGVTQATFDIKTVDVSTSHQIFITAELEGEQYVDSLTVSPWLLSFNVAPNTIVGGNQTVGRVNLARPAVGTFQVEVTSPDLRKVRVVDDAGNQLDRIPIQNGQSLAAFRLQTFGIDRTSAPDGGESVTLLARIVTPNLQVVRTTSMRVIPASLLGFSITPNRVNANEATKGTVRLNGMAGPSGITFNVSLGSGTGRVTIPSTVTVPAFTSQVDFPIQTIGSTDAFREIVVSRANPAQSARATVFLEGNTITSITLDPPSVLGGGTINAFVTLSKPAAPSGFDVKIVLNPPTGSSPYADVSVTRVKVAPGATKSPEFQITTKSVRSTVNLTIVAGKEGGYASKSAVMTIRPISLNFTMSPTSIIGGAENSTGTLTLNEPASQGGLNVSLTSSDPATLSVPGQVAFAQGDQTKTFTATSSEVFAQKNVTITATIGTLPTAIVIQRTVTVRPIPAQVVSLTLNPRTLKGGASFTGTVTIERTAPPGGIVVRLAKDPNATGSPFVSIPATVTVPAGQTTVSFTGTTQATSRTVGTTLSASVGNTTATSTLIINP